jgi:hypothetical protein
LLTRLKRPATETDPEVSGLGFIDTLRIEVPDLVQLTSANSPVIFADGGSCPHERLPHWFTHNSLDRMHALAQAYTLVTGRRLSVNDASLPYGGIIDNKLSKGGGRDAACHVSHRDGVDVDLNRRDSGNVDVLTEKMTVNGREQPVIMWITALVERFGGFRVLEETIHYRFPN